MMLVLMGEKVDNLLTRLVTLWFRFVRLEGFLKNNEQEGGKTYRAYFRDERRPQKVLGCSMLQKVSPKAQLDPLNPPKGSARSAACPWLKLQL